MSDPQTAPVAAPATPEKPVKPPKPPKVELLKQNGETRPKAGSKTSRPWEIADALSASTGKPAVRKAVIEQAVSEGYSAAMAASQYGRWRRFNGLQREVRVTPPAAPAADQAAAPTTAPAPAPASDVSVQPAS